MQLINVVPDNIVDWIGGRISTSSLGKNASDEVGGAAKSALAGGGWIPHGRNKGGGGGAATDPTKAAAEVVGPGKHKEV